MSDRIFDRFYLYAGISLIPLAVMVIIVARGIFGALATAGQVDEALLDSSNPRIEQAQLDGAYKKTVESEFVPLDLRE